MVNSKKQLRKEKARIRGIIDIEMESISNSVKEKWKNILIEIHDSVKELEDESTESKMRVNAKRYMGKKLTFLLD